MTGHLKRVVRVEFVRSKNHAPDGGTNYLTLECGHVERQRKSYEVPARKNCSICAAINPEGMVKRTMKPLGGNLYQAQPGGRYYGRITIQGQRAWRAIDAQSISRARLKLEKLLARSAELR